MPTFEAVYGWRVPEDTDPAKNGAGDMRALASDISGTLRSPAWCRAWSAADQTLGADGWSQVVLGNETDPGDIFAASAVTLPYAGVVGVGWGATVGLSGAAPTTVNIASALYVDGAEYQRGSSFASSSAPSLQQFGTAGSTLVDAVAGRVLTLMVFVAVPGTTKKVLAAGTHLEARYFAPRPKP